MFYCQNKSMTANSDSTGEELISDTESVGSVDPSEAYAKDQPDTEMTEEFSQEEAKKAEDFKAKGNAHFKESRYDQAIDFYTEAIFCKIPPAQKAVLYCNRSLSNLKMENSSIALFGKLKLFQKLICSLLDACECIKLDETNAKGYYRRG